MREYVKTKDQAAAIKKALVPHFGAKNVSVTKGTGTASHWISCKVEIPIAENCFCEQPGISWGDKMCHWCRARYIEADLRTERIAKMVVEKLGGFSSYYSDDYTDSKPYDCFNSQIRFIRPVTQTN